MAKDDPQQRQQEQQQQSQGGANQPDDQGGAGDQGSVDNTMEQLEGLTPEEQKAFADMQAATSDDGAAVGAADTGAQGDGDGQGADGDGAGGDQEGDQGDGQKGAARRAAAAQGDGEGEGDAGEGEEGDDDAEGEGQQQRTAGEGEQQQQREPKRVSFGKFKRTEDALKDARAKLAQREQEFARADERLRILTEAIGGPKPGQQQQQQEDDDPEPDETKDAFEWIAWSKRERGRMAKRLDALEGGQQSAVASRNMETAFLADSQAFTRGQGDDAPGVPDYPQAYQYLMAARTVQVALTEHGKDLLAGDKLTPDEVAAIKQTVEREEQYLVNQAFKKKQSPARRIYQLARSMGYRPPAADEGDGGDQGDGQQQQRAGNGQQKPGAKNGQGGQQQQRQGQQQQKGSVREEIKRIAEGQEAATTLSTGGGGPRAPLTMERLASMSQDQFDALASNMDEDALRTIMGGGP